MSKKEAGVMAGLAIDRKMADEVIANQELIIANLNEIISNLREINAIDKSIIKDQKLLIACLENGGIMPMKLWKKLLLSGIAIFLLFLMVTN